MYGNDEMSDRLSWELHGYYIHLEWECDSPSVANYHTHGLWHSRGKQDFRMEAPIDPFLAVSIFRELVERIDRGLMIEPGDCFSDVLPGMTLGIGQSDDETILYVSINKTSLA